MIISLLVSHQISLYQFINQKLNIHLTLKLWLLYLYHYLSIYAQHFATEG